ncbi:hypothetical protein DEU56DRAFT_796599 [Suillus clintonianus]|uniref:uncharacterized protein n=1 Tax=Suillus clintonianus TaxID=1904413 RepID=UPI001B85D888|nr:uncharacterized protein DEU56DRAFT_796599 [Suillus clintonianus]KAG2141003.1 hypothetical protein DEU56DRAFT_796599 [Suillus clintonianus]
MGHTLRNVRIFILSFTLILAIVVLGISAHLIAIRPTDYWRFAALAVAVSSLTILTFPLFIILAFSVTRQGKHGVIVAEAMWSTIMWILWLSTGANSTRAARRTFFSGACGVFTFYGSKTCNEFKTVEAFAYIIFIILLGYTIGLMVYEFTHESDRGTGASRGGIETGTGQKPPPQTQRQQQSTTSGQSTDASHGQQKSADDTIQFPQPNQ